MFVMHRRAVQSVLRSDEFTQRRTHMINPILAGRVVQALLAITATAVSVLVLQFAMLTG